MDKHRVRIMLVALWAGPFAAAQHAADHWYFGDHAGIDFTSGSAVAVGDGALYSWEACTSISDPATGDLLFYSNGQSVWNAQHQVMPNGSGLMGCDSPQINSTSQGVLIVPDPGSPSRYYLFTAPCAESGLTDNIKFSVVDMQLDGGLGDVTVKDSSIYSTPCVESLTYTADAAGTGYWLMGHEWNNNAYVRFQITPSGISPPQVQAIGGLLTQVGTTNDGAVCGGAFSPSGTRFAFQSQPWNHVELYRFDPVTGLLSDVLVLPLDSALHPSDYGHSVSFSPSSCRLYASRVFGPLYQWDLSSGSDADIVASRTKLILNLCYGGNMQLAPDGRLYIAQLFGLGLSCIEFPDELGAAAGFQLSGLPVIGSSMYGLPQYCSRWFAPPVAQDCAELPTAVQHAPRPTPQLLVVPTGAGVDLHLSGLGPIDLRVYDALGRCVWQERSFSDGMPMRLVLPSGSYVAVARGPQADLQRRFLVQR